MIILIDYKTRYIYESVVGFSRHIFRLFPREDRFTSIRELAFETNAGADVQHRRDIFDNEVVHAFYPERGTELSASLHLELELREKNAFHFLLDSHALNFPFTYSEHERKVLSPYLSHGGSVALPFWKAPAEPEPTVAALVALNLAIHENIQYERRDEGTAYSPEETLRRGSGACRDFALLHAGALRTNGVAARFASGYLCEFGEKERRAEGSLHAWTEAYLPGAGWVGFDPTNGLLCAENHITAAVGLTPEDVSPIDGTYYSDTPIPSKMDVSLHLRKIPLPPGTPAPAV